MSADLITDLALAAVFLAGALMLVLGTVTRRRSRRSAASGRPDVALLGAHIVTADGGGHCSPAEGGSAGCDSGGGSA